VVGHPIDFRRRFFMKIKGLMNFQYHGIAQRFHGGFQLAPRTDVNPV
jgi:hypothetical protein